MRWFKDKLLINSRGKGLYEFTPQLADTISKWRIDEGICHLFLQHTSASLVISESYDPSARRDLEEFLERLAPENQNWYRHTSEGPDDSPSHMRSILTSTSLSIPIDDGALNLGTWQGIYLFEHRSSSHSRKILVRCLSVD